MRIGIPTWAVVAIGLVLNIVAALMTNFVIDGLGEQSASVIETQTNNNQLIQLSWQQLDALERRRETIMVILAVKPDMGSLPLPFSRRLLQSFNDMSETAVTQHNMPLIMDAIDQQQDLLRNKIDTLYLDNLQLADSQRDLGSKISAYRNLALFLQVLGLALIMARDLSRKPS
ncbi:hypothetical protein A1OQ_08385 [Enterovibrio norvegicus FF-162]|uniref:hypothetical protein n=1 Tax=Enterovibrio norvegicus TaxID=188144 RepID=UPI0002DFF659|nr:hypothetical protein [Enterovibrio norvegicus]OEE74832.1 hypothetical protein A1OQ_08385 [Enterovibrio norvegicus FF-162]